MNPLLMEDTFIQICHQINDVKTIIMIEEISQWHKKVIRKNKWIYLKIRIRSDEKLINMIRTHNFSNLNLMYTNVTDESVSMLVNIHILYLGLTKVTNACIEKLKYNGCIVYK